MAASSRLVSNSFKDFTVIPSSLLFKKPAHRYFLEMYHFTVYLPYWMEGILTKAFVAVSTSRRTF